MSIEVLEQLAMCGDPRQAAIFLQSQSSSIQESVAQQDVAMMQAIVLEQQASVNEHLLAMQANEVMVTHF